MTRRIGLPAAVEVLLDIGPVETLLEQLSAAAQEALRQRSVERRFAKGEVVFHEGDPGESAHLVTHGLFAARSSSTLGHILTVNAFRPGGVFGEMALLTKDATRSATVLAVHAGRTRMIHRADFHQLRADFPEVNDALLAILADRNRRLTAQVVELLFTPTHQRVHRRLLELDELGVATDANGWIVLGQDDLAMLTATTRATVNRALREAERRGCVELKRGRSRVIDRPMLFRLAH